MSDESDPEHPAAMATNARAATRRTLTSKNHPRERSTRPSAAGSFRAASTHDPRHGNFLPESGGRSGRSREVPTAGWISPRHPTGWWGRG
jgi:hypothetical protein